MAAKHINAKHSDIADTVLMPGDPLRAKFIAETYLDEPRRINDVRNMWGYTGEYQGLQLTIMPHGMGIPSSSIYCSELITEYGVSRLIRVGSCGTANPRVKLRDVIIAMGASTDSGVNRMRFGGFDLAALASFELLRVAVETAEQKGADYHVGNIFSADLFYTPQPEMFELMNKYNILGVEMETAGIYTLAAEHDVDALAICTVSDDLTNGDHLSTEDRQSTFKDMIEIALDTVVAASR